MNSIPTSATSLLYDPDGNLTNDGHFSYVWNSENQLTSIASLTNTPAESKRKLTFEYDALGRRIRAGVSRWTNSTWLVTSSNKFVYDGWNLVAELNATNNALVRSYVWGLDLSGSMDEAGGVGGLLWVNDASTLGSNSTHCVAYDGNGNVTALVDAGSGNETARYEYGPFGDLTQASGLMARANPIRFLPSITTTRADWFITAIDTTHRLLIAGSIAILWAKKVDSISMGSWRTIRSVAWILTAVSYSSRWRWGSAIWLAN